MLTTAWCKRAPSWGVGCVNYSYKVSILALGGTARRLYNVSCIAIKNLDLTAMASYPYFMGRDFLRLAYELAVTALGECCHPHIPEELVDEFKARLQYRLFGDLERLRDEED